MVLYNSIYIIKTQLSEIQMKNHIHQQQLYKIVIVGNSGSGKTNIATRYIKGQFTSTQTMTVGVQFFSKTIKIQTNDIKITLWDTGGQQKFKSLSKIYYKGSSAMLVVYDVTDPQSYLDVQLWLRLINQNVKLSQIVLMIVGNKSDLYQDKKVTTERVQYQYKDKFDIDCWEVSAKTGYHINQLFTDLIQKIYQMHIGLHGSHIKYGQSEFGDTIVKIPPSVVGQDYKKGSIVAKSKINEFFNEDVIEQELTQFPLKDSGRMSRNSVKLTPMDEKTAKGKKKCCP